MLMRLTLALTMLAPPSQEAADAAYNDGEFRKALDLFRQRAADPGVHRPDALHEETGEAEHLCGALALARELLATGPLADDDERAAWVEIEARDADRMHRAEVTCTAAPPTATPTPPARLLASTEQIEPDVDGLLPVTGRPPAARSTTPTPPRGRGLVIAGMATLGVGLGLAAAAGYLGGRRLDAWRDGEALYEEAGPVGNPAEADKSAALAHDYYRLRPPMLTTAIVGASAIVVGAVLVGVGAKRLARATSTAALLPAPGGLVLRVRF